MSQNFNMLIPPINNNPLLPGGRIHRLSYFLTSLVLSCASAPFIRVGEIIDQAAGSVNLSAVGWIPLIMAILQVFAMIKRCRDIQYSPWTVFLVFIPIVNFVYGLLLLFKASKYND